MRVQRTTTIYALFLFIAHHQEGVAAVVFTMAALTAIPLFRFRRRPPLGFDRGRRPTA